MRSGDVLTTAAQAIVGQDYGYVECLVAAADGALPLDTYRADGNGGHDVRLVQSGDATSALNLAFAESGGDVMAWLDPGSILTPWACRVAVHFFEAFPQIEWLTSAVWYDWSRDRLLISDGLGDGYSAASFYSGRNLKPSPYFHHPIVRGGTFWRRGLWEKSGARVRADLASAGDFELWCRFFQYSGLASCLLPLSGHDIAAPVEDDVYWSAAARWLASHPARRNPPRWVALKRLILRRRPRWARRWTSKGIILTIAAPTNECGSREISIV
jgi:hypothetical protein